MPRQNIIILVTVLAVSLVCAARTSLPEQIFHYALRKIEVEGLAPVDRLALLEAGLDGVTQQVPDYPYTAYLPAEEEAEYEEEIQGRLAGVGVFRMQLDPTSSHLWFTPLYDAPAREAGLQFGDQIVTADGKNFLGKSVADIAELLRGDEGTTVRLTVLPREMILSDAKAENSPSAADKNAEDADAPVSMKEVELTRRRIRQEIVSGDRRDEEGGWIFRLETAPEIAYIKIEQFTDDTAPDFAAALDSLEEKSVRALVIDLRGNPGGFLPAAISVCNHFLPEGSLIVSTRNRAGQSKGRFFAHGGKKFTHPVAILLDGASASASEIVSAALADHQRGKIIGTRSYGKGTVQELFSLPCGMGLLRLTDASFWRPSDEPIHRHRGMSAGETWGVRPDAGYEVPLSPRKIGEMVLRRDVRSLAASERGFAGIDELIRRRLDSLTDPAELVEMGRDEEEFLPQKDAVESPDSETDSSPHESPKKPDRPESTLDPLGTAPYFDPQLDRAIEYLRDVVKGGEH